MITTAPITMNRPAHTTTEAQAQARTTRIEVHRTPDGLRSVLRTGLLAPRVTARHDDGLAVTLVATEATLLGGDHLNLELVLGAGTHLDLTDVAATVAYDGRGESARWSTWIRLGTGARLTWWGEPLVVCDGAAVHRSTHAQLAAGATMVLRDAITLGRHGERGGRLHCRTRFDLAGRTAVVEDLALDDRHRGDAGFLPGRQIDTVTLLGRRPAAETSGASRDVFELALPGAVHRTLDPAPQTSRSVFDDWRGVPATT